jgi:AmmeMemoRadiSam system protein B
MKIKQNRQPLAQGILYPSEVEKLRQKIAPLKPRGTYNFLLLPHGSWDYIFPALEQAWKESSAGIKKILLIGPVHLESICPLAYPGNRYFLTPLGPVPLASREMRALNKRCSLYHQDQRPHEEEHDLEIHLPMVQTFHPKVRIIPLLMGTMDEKAIEQAAQELIPPRENLEEWLIILSANTGIFCPGEQAERDFQKLKQWINHPPAWPEIFHQSQEFPGCFSGPLSLLSAAGLLPLKLELLGKSVYTEKKDSQYYCSWGGKIPLREGGL